MINSYKRFWTKAFDFKGRSTRNEYWFAVLANFLINLLFLIIFSVLTLINENLGLVIYFIYFFYNNLYMVYCPKKRINYKIHMIIK